MLIGGANGVSQFKEFTKEWELLIEVMASNHKDIDTLGKIVKLLSYKTNGLEKFKIQPPRLNAKWLVSLLQQAFLICEANHYTVEFTRLA
jgi:hypothetical protein